MNLAGEQLYQYWAMLSLFLQWLLKESNLFAIVTKHTQLPLRKRELHQEGMKYIENTEKGQSLLLHHNLEGCLVTLMKKATTQAWDGPSFWVYMTGCSPFYMGVSRWTFFQSQKERLVEGKVPDSVPPMWLPPPPCPTSWCSGCSLRPPSPSSHLYMTTLCCSISPLPLAWVIAVGTGACKETPEKCTKTWDCRKPGWLSPFIDDYSSRAGQTSWHHSRVKRHHKNDHTFIFHSFCFVLFCLFVCLFERPSHLQSMAESHRTNYSSVNAPCCCCMSAGMKYSTSAMGLLQHLGMYQEACGTNCNVAE